MPKLIRLLLSFYKSYFIAAILINGCCLYIFSMYGTAVFMALFWFKAATLWLTYFFIKAYKSKEFYYYQNLGVSKLVLWGSTLGFDFILFIFLLILANKLR